MSGRWSPIQTYDPQEAADPREAADGGYFAPLASARYLQVTTSGRDGRPVPARLYGVVDGGRAYVGARSWSGTVRRLRHCDAAQVAPCGALGLCYGPPLDAVARPLPAGQAGRAAAELARKYPVRRPSPTSWLPRAWRPKTVHYELVADVAPDDRDADPPGGPAAGPRGDQSGRNAAPGSPGSGPCQIVRTQVTDHGISSIACIWPASTEAARNTHLPLAAR
jgi:PPOX class probable F420-dependent enzyme